jgi:hypothetical protein
MCEYVVTDHLRYQGYPSSLGATTELMRCRFTLKNFAWNEHWLMFLPYGVGKEARAPRLPPAAKRYQL